MAVKITTGWFDPDTLTIGRAGINVASATVSTTDNKISIPLNADAKLIQLVQTLSHCYVCGNDDQVFILCGICAEAVKRSRIALVEEVLDTLAES